MEVQKPPAAPHLDEYGYEWLICNKAMSVVLENRSVTEKVISRCAL